MNKKQRLLLGGVLVVVIFFVTTFSKNWGPAVSENLLEKLKPEVIKLQNDPQAAAAVCPQIITKLEAGIPELSKGKDPNQVQLANKLIADCAFAAKNYSKSLEYYRKLSRYEPNVARWYALVAESMFLSNNAADALHYSVLATQLDPEKFEYRLLNARVLAKLELKNRAIQAYTQAIKLAPFDKISITKAELQLLVGDSEDKDSDAISDESGE